MSRRPWWKLPKSKTECRTCSCREQRIEIHLDGKAFKPEMIRVSPRETPDQLP